MPTLVQVPLVGQNLDCYTDRSWQLENGLTGRGGRAKRPLSKSQFLARMSNYCCVGTYYTRISLQHERRMLLEHGASFACKLSKICDDVLIDWIAQGGKAVVMVHRTNGFKGMCTLLNHRAKLLNAEAEGKGETDEDAPPPLHVSSYPPCLPHEQDSTPSDVLQRFNDRSNDQGGSAGVLVVDAKVAGEGVSLFSVRRLYLGDVPWSWMDYQQRVGRVVRFCSHTRLPEEEREVEVKIYTATCPEMGK